MAKLAAAHPTLSDDGANFDPIYKLLNAKTNNEHWNPMLAGALQSVLANRQYTQLRCFQAGWARHPKCLSCVHTAVTQAQHKAVMPSQPASRKTEATPSTTPTPPRPPNFTTSSGATFAATACLQRPPRSAEQQTAASSRARHTRAD